jgi:DNA-binding transcriptional regulator YhcF (GntR family)
MTSVENVFEQLEEQGIVFKSANNLLHISIDASDYLDIKRLCKEMHKQEIIKAFDEGQEYEYQYHINNSPKFDSETYYNETYGSKLEQLLKQTKKD